MLHTCVTCVSGEQIARARDKCDYRHAKEGLIEVKLSSQLATSRRDPRMGRASTVTWKSRKVARLNLPFPHNLSSEPTELNFANSVFNLIQTTRRLQLMDGEHFVTFVPYNPQLAARSWNPRLN